MKPVIKYKMIKIRIVKYVLMMKYINVKWQFKSLDISYSSIILNYLLNKRHRR